MNMDKIYVIYECTGDYDMYCETPLGFKLSEEEAIAYVEKRNTYYNELEDIVINDYYDTIQAEKWNWDNIAEGITEEIFATTDVPGYKDDRVVNGQEYTNWTINYFTPLLDEKRCEYFEKTLDAKQYLPKGMNWKEFLKMWDDYEDYKQYLYDYRYECVTKLEE